MGLLRHRTVRALLGAQLLSASGDYAYMVALGVWLWSTTGSALWVAAGVLARMVPGVILGTIGGRMADRLHRRRLMIGADAVRCVQMTALALMVAGGLPAWSVVAVVATIACTGLPWVPAAVKYVSEIVDEDDQARMNSIYELSAQVAVFVGPGIAAILLAASDAMWPVFALNAVTFVLSAALIRCLPPGAPAGAEEAGSTARTSGLRLVVASAATMVISAAVFMQTLQFGFEQAAFPIVSTEVLDLGDGGAGLLFAALGVGGLVAAPLSTRLVAWMSPPRLLTLTFAVEAVFVGVLGFRLPGPLAVAAAFMAGIASFAFEVAVLAALQQFVAPEQVGAFYGTLGAVASAGMLLGAFVLPTFTEVFAIGEVVVASAVVSVIVAAVVWRKAGGLTDALRSPSEAA